MTSESTRPVCLLAPLLAPIASLPGLKPGLAGLLGRAVGGTTLIDLLLHLPQVPPTDRRYQPELGHAEQGRIATLRVSVRHIQRPGRPRQPWRVLVADATGEADLVFFSQHQARGLAAGAEIVVSGRLEQFGGRLQMTHPDHLLPRARAAALPLIEAVWPLTTGLVAKVVAGSLRAAFARMPALPEWLDPSVLDERRWPDFASALRLLHFPADTLRCAEISVVEAAQARARARLACDELLASQIASGRARRRNRTLPGRSLRGDGSLRAEALRHFGHTPTSAQNRVLAEIDADLAAPRRMLRLLQGDVGAGKTLVACLAMLRAAEAGAQAALMAPTELLARQHHATLSRIAPLPVALLTGSIKGAARTRARGLLATGAVKLAVGTHALFQQGVEFADMALAVIDEQHRFGVEQRLMLRDKGSRTDVLVMTATPIPRTLLLTQWGEMQVSRLDAKPASRLPIRTTLHSLEQVGAVLAGIARAIEKGAQLFWVCPLVSESETLDVAAAEARALSLGERFGSANVGLAHGRQEIAVREAALGAFAAGHTRILVATTVIEVGVDVPSATVMVVEHAERFGLAQLHQLRGRVGRGVVQSYCLLLHEDSVGETARARLTMLRDTEDGFRIADEDHRLRGGGDPMGKRQSGLAGFRLATGPCLLNTELDVLLRLAWQDAERLLGDDPELGSERGKAVLTLLDLFGRENSVRALASG